MRTFVSFAILAAFPALIHAGDGRFNGRWDITASNGGAWWLEVTGAETGHPAGRFVTAFNGDMNTIERITVKTGVLEFGWPARQLAYTARIAGEGLEGTFQSGSEPPVKWTAVRAPVIKDRDDGSWREGKPVTLFNGKDLTGWVSTDGGPIRGWSASNGVLTATGEGRDIITTSKFWNFKLHAEFRVPPHSNSGVGLRTRYEVQVLEDYGKPPDTHTNGALYSRIPPGVNASKPANEWQTFDIRLVGRQVTVVLNGKTVIDHGEIEGLTAIALDSNEAQPGPVYLQGDHGRVDYRNIVLTPLTK